MKSIVDHPEQMSFEVMSDGVPFQAISPSLQGLPTEIRLEIFRHLICCEDLLLDRPLIIRAHDLNFGFNWINGRPSEEHHQPHERIIGKMSSELHPGSVTRRTGENGQEYDISAPAGASEAESLFESSRQYKLHTTILRVCKQFYEEGKALLYQSKTVALLYNVYNDQPPRTYALGCRDLKDATKKFPDFFRQVRKWQVMIYIHPDHKFLNSMSIDMNLDRMAWADHLAQDIAILNTLARPASITFDLFRLGNNNCSPNNRPDSGEMIKALRLFMNSFRGVRTDRCKTIVHGPLDLDIYNRSNIKIARITEKAMHEMTCIDLSTIGFQELVLSTIRTFRSFLSCTNRVDWGRVDIWDSPNPFTAPQSAEVPLFRLPMLHAIHELARNVEACDKIGMELNLDKFRIKALEVLHKLQSQLGLIKQALVNGDTLLGFNGYPMKVIPEQINQGLDHFQEQFDILEQRSHLSFPGGRAMDSWIERCRCCFD